MGLDKISILGVLVDNLTMDEVVDKIFDMIDEFQEKELPRQLATLNVDFLVNAHSWHPEYSRHPELLKILRHADIVTADGMPIIWMSKLIGAPLKERITGADLVPRLAEESANRGKSIYFLGGSNDSGKQAALILKDRFPELKIAGVDATYVNTKGQALLNSTHQDTRIIDDINSSGADILLVGYGNPKQEEWFEMNRKKIKSLVSIGVGGTFAFISGSTKRAPKWAQKAGMEWLFRIIHDPRRLWKRYLTGIFKFNFMALPVILYYQYRMIRDRIFQRSHEKDKLGSLGYETIDEGIKLIKLPNRLDHASLAVINEEIGPLIKSLPYVIFDLSDTSFIDPYGLGYLITLLRDRNKKQHSTYLTGVSKSIIRVFKINRIWDLFKKITYKDVNEIIRTVKVNSFRPPFHIKSKSCPDSFRIDLHGKLDSDSVLGLNLPSIIEDIGDRDCLLNLRELEFIDSSGIAFLLRIHKHLADNNRTPVLCGLSENINQMLRIKNLTGLFEIAQDINK